VDRPPLAAALAARHPPLAVARCRHTHCRRPTSTVAVAERLQASTMGVGPAHPHVHRSMPRMRTAVATVAVATVAVAVATVLADTVLVAVAAATAVDMALAAALATAVGTVEVAMVLATGVAMVLATGWAMAAAEIATVVVVATAATAATGVGVTRLRRPSHLLALRGRPRSRTVALLLISCRLCEGFEEMMRARLLAHLAARHLHGRDCTA